MLTETVVHRVFHCVVDTSQKVWAVTVRHSTMDVEFGRIGGVLQHKSTVFPTAAKAREAAEKLANEKAAKGYIEIDPETRNPLHAPQDRTVFGSLVGPGSLNDAQRAKRLWAKVHRQLGRQHSAMLAVGANPVVFTRLEQVFQVKFDEAFRAVWSMHDGSGTHRFMNQRAVLSLAGMEASWKRWNAWYESVKSNEVPVPMRATDTMQHVLWSPRWIPITEDAEGNSHCIDFAPGPKGSVGQIVSVWKSGSARRVAAEDIFDLLTHATWDAG